MLARASGSVEAGAHTLTGNLRFALRACFALPVPTMRRRSERWAEGVFRGDVRVAGVWRASGGRGDSPTLRRGSHAVRPAQSDLWGGSSARIGRWFSTRLSRLRCGCNFWQHGMLPFVNKSDRFDETGQQAFGVRGENVVMPDHVLRKSTYVQVVRE